MNDDRKTTDTSQHNEGEGNRTAARAYNKAAHRTAKSGDVEKKAHEAKEAREGRERAELEKAETIGKRRALCLISASARQRRPRLTAHWF